MKGLLIKDLRLLAGQKRLMGFLLLAIMFMLGMTPEFMIGYIIMLAVILTVSTVSYDEFEHGMSFLLTLPVSRKVYVYEKYVLGLLAAGVAYVFATLFGMAALLIKGVYSGMPDYGAAVSLPLTGLAVLLVMLLMWELMLPLQLKFGAEKARVVIVAVVAVVAGAFFILKDKPDVGNKLAGVLSGLSALPDAAIIAGLVLVSLLALLVSVLFSLHIMEKKEY